MYPRPLPSAPTNCAPRANCAQQGGHEFVCKHLLAHEEHLRRIKNERQPVKAAVLCDGAGHSLPALGVFWLWVAINTPEQASTYDTYIGGSCIASG